MSCKPTYKGKRYKNLTEIKKLATKDANNEANYQTKLDFNTEPMLQEIYRSAVIEQNTAVPLPILEGDVNKRQFNKIKEQVVSENIASKVWNINNSNDITKAPNGQESLLFKSIQMIHSDMLPKHHFIVKSYIYSDKFIAENGDWIKGQANSKLELDINGEPIMDVNEFSDLIYFKNGQLSRLKSVEHLNKVIALAQTELLIQQEDIFSLVITREFTDESILENVLNINPLTTNFTNKRGSNVILTKTISKNDALYSKDGSAEFSKSMLRGRFNSLHNIIKNQYGVTFDILKYDEDSKVISISPAKDILFAEHLKKVEAYNKRQDRDLAISRKSIKDMLTIRLTKLETLRDQLQNEDPSDFLASIGTAENATFAEAELDPESFGEEDAKETERLAIFINQRIKSLNSKITGKTDPKIRYVIYDRIDKLENDRKSLKSDLSFSNIQRIATRQLDEISSMVNNKAELTYPDLLNALSIADIWKWENSILFLTKGQQENQFNNFNILFSEISGKAQKLSLGLMNKITTQLQKDIKNNILPDSDVQALSEMKLGGFFTNAFMGLSDSDSPLIQYLDVILKNSERHQVGLLNNILDNINTIFDNLEDKSGYTDYWQTDEDGKRTHNLINRFSRSYNKFISNRYKSRSSYFYLHEVDQISTSQLKDMLYKLDVDFKKKMIVLDVNALFDGGKVAMDNSMTRSNYIEYLEKVLGGKKIVELVIEESKLKKEQYMADRAAYKQGLIDEGIDVNGIDDLLNFWEEQHSPNVYINSIYKDNAKSINNDGSRYTVSIPKYRNLNANGSEGVKTGFYDERYIELMQNENKAEFYIKYSELMESLKGYLPEEVTDLLPVNMIPAIQKDLLESYTADGLFAVKNQISDKLISYMTNPEPSKLSSNLKVASKDMDFTTNRVRKSVPTQYLTPKDTDETTMDLKKIAILFAGMVVNYNFKSQIEDKAIIIQRVVKNLEEVAEDDRGNRMINGMTGKLLTYTDGLDIVNKVVGHAIDATVYGMHKGDTNKSSKAKIRTLNPIVHLDVLSDKFEFINNIKAIKNKHKRLQIEQLYNELEEDYINGKITDAVYKAKLNNLEGLYAEVSGKALSIINITETAMKWTQLKALGLNAPAGFSNLLFGINSNFIRANGRTDFDVNTLFKAQGAIIKESFKKSGKISKLINKFDVLFDVVDSRYGTKESIPISSKDANIKRKIFSKISNFEPFMFQTKGEHFIQGSSFIAHMMFKKVTTAEGNEISIFEAYDEDGNWKSELFDDATNEQWNNIFTSTETRNEFSKFRDRSIEMNKKMHGNYDYSSPILIKRYLIGRLLMQFRSWVPEGINNRFADKKYNAQLGRHYKGRWTTYRELGPKKAIRTLIKQIMYMNPETAFSDIEDDVDIENMRQNLAELVVLGNTVLALLLLSLAIMGTDDDDDEILKRRTLLVLYNKTYRSLQDIYFYISPNSAFSVLKSPVPAVRAFQDLGKAASRSFQAIYEGDSYNGYDPSYFWAKNLPFINQWNNIKYIATHRVD